MASRHSAEAECARYQGRQVADADFALPRASPVLVPSQVEPGRAQRGSAAAHRGRRDSRDLCAGGFDQWQHWSISPFRRMRVNLLRRRLGCGHGRFCLLTLDSLACHAPCNSGLLVAEALPPSSFDLHTHHLHSLSRFTLCHPISLRGPLFRKQHPMLA